MRGLQGEPWLVAAVLSTGLHQLSGLDFRNWSQAPKSYGNKPEFEVEISGYGMQNTPLPERKAQ
jgi:hypothetical protein